MNRREFLGASALAGFAMNSQAQTAPRIRQVDIVHHTHTDVGYTELPSVIRDLQVRYLDAAIDACADDRSFRWTVESLVEVDDWFRNTTSARYDRLMALVNAGQMDVMALPFNQTGFLNAVQWRQMMSWIDSDMWGALRIRVAMQNDVNGFPRAGAIALLDRNIRHLLMGINADSGGPPFRRPSAFWWKMPDGSRLFVWLGEHYGTAMRYLEPARKGPLLLTDDASLRAAQKTLVEHLRAIEAEGYEYDRLILTFTHPDNYDNGGPFPSLGPFVEAWNRQGLEPRLRLALATEAVLDMEKAAGASAPELEGEWTDWWANGTASGPRELAASRVAKRYVAGALSALWGAVPPKVTQELEPMLKDLCLFDEHTWGASGSISAPDSLGSIAQYVEKSALAYRPMGASEKLFLRRLRAKVDSLPEGLYVVNAAPAEVSGWASGAPRNAPVWVEKIPPHTMRPQGAAEASTATPEVKLDSLSWPRFALWPGMRKPLFEGSLGEFLCVGFIPPADRRTITQLHANANAAERAQIRAKSLRQTAATYSTAQIRETPHTLVWTQEFKHERLAQGRRTVELWRREARARVSIRIDRISSMAPEVLFIDFTMPEATPLPTVSSGGVPFVPYKDQLKGACRDYFAIDGWAQFAMPEGHWLWVTRDAALMAIGGPHVLERHQEQPADTRRIQAMVFDNCWHTNFVANSHGVMEWQFDLVWREKIDAPADLAEALMTDPVAYQNPAIREPAPVLNHVFRP